MLDALVHGKNREVARSAQPTVVEDRLQVAQNRDRPVAICHDSIDEVRPRGVQGRFVNRAAPVGQEIVRLCSEYFANPAHAFSPPLAFPPAELGKVASTSPTVQLACGPPINPYPGCFFPGHAFRPTGSENRLRPDICDGPRVRRGTPPCGGAVETARRRQPTARVAEVVDALDLGSSGATRGGSSPPSRIPGGARLEGLFLESPGGVS